MRAGLQLLNTHCQDSPLTLHELFYHCFCSLLLPQLWVRIFESVWTEETYLCMEPQHISPGRACNSTPDQYLVTRPMSITAAKCVKHLREVIQSDSL